MVDKMMGWLNDLLPKKLDRASWHDVKLMKWLGAKIKKQRSGWESVKLMNWLSTKIKPQRVCLQNGKLTEWFGTKRYSWESVQLIN